MHLIQNKTLIKGGYVILKKRHSLHQFKKQDEAASVPSTESIANDCIALQQFLASYNSENIWNSNETDLNAYEYIYIEDKIPEGGLTDDKIVDIVLNTNKEGENMNEIEFISILEKVSLIEAEKFISETMRFLYEQECKFGKVSEELKVLRKLHK
ncbi:13459_t:CDS:2 [Funneliformis mosseae]|uniref:13459_t:CDS:1 n=1 Tax=Funneliformis mosseae TaxID=27381 RepID=A0A9N8Z5H9_FUNMO|nr:13459_t:CDS:2 [Funneliformis mosseae]